MADNIPADELREIVERIERVEEEMDGIKDDRKDLYMEAKSRGYDTKILRMIVRLRKMERDKLQEQDALLETYRGALGIG